MKEGKRLWQLKAPTVCEILGTALDTKDVFKLARKFRLTNNNDLVHDELAFHSALVEFSQSVNPVSRYTDKLIRKRFELHMNKLADLSPKSVIKTLRIEVNSHNAARFAKKICKLNGIPCCFVKSASLASLKRTIEGNIQKATAA